VGIEVVYSGGSGYINSYDHGAPGYVPLTINASTITLAQQSGGNIKLPNGGLDAAGTLRATGQSVPSSGAGVEIVYAGGTGFVIAYDRTAGQYKPINFNNSPLAGAGGLDMSNYVRISGLSTPPAGAGLELLYDSGGGTAIIQSYDRTASAIKALNLQASNVHVATTMDVQGSLTTNGALYINNWFVFQTTLSGDWQLKIQNLGYAANTLGCWYSLGPSASVSDGSCYFQWMSGSASASGVGAIARNGTNTVGYGTSSDARLKTMVHEDSKRGLDTLRQIAVRDFYFTADEEKIEYSGFYAQELQVFYPDAVMCMDEHDQNGKATGDKLWMIDYGRLSPLAVRAIQQLADTVDRLSARIAELEGRR
jgi:hypothetical protein